MKKTKTSQADVGYCKAKKDAKKAKAREERRRAKRDPESPNGYRKYGGWLS